MAHIEASGVSPTAPTGTEEDSQGTAYISVTLKTLTEAPGADQRRYDELEETGEKGCVNSPFYRVAVVGQREKIPLKTFNNKQVFIIASPQQVVTSQELTVASQNRLSRTQNS